jgi:hypothetical protein
VFNQIPVVGPPQQLGDYLVEFTDLLELFTDLLGSTIDLFSSLEFTDLLSLLILSDVKVVRIGAADRGHANRRWRTEVG